MINEKLLLENGYKEYKPNKIFYPSASKHFQKRVRNDKGHTKYFINIYKYIHNDKNVYEVDLQFEKQQYAMDIQLFGLNEKMTLEEIEKEVYKIWYDLDCKYYDCEVEE